jgi:surfeit locus 1 family protein
MTSDARPGRRPAWVPTLAAFAAIALFVTAGNWQHRRLHEKEALQERSMRAMSLGPVPLPQGVPDWQAWRFRQVMVSGEYDAKRQILIDNKVHEQRPGFDVVTPLALADGRVVLVDRGWIAAGPTRTMLPDVPPPPGTITLRGRIDIPPADYYELGERRAPAGPVWQHLDPARFADATGVAVLPIVIEALDEGSGNGLVRDWPAPDAGMEQHLSYMVQWYTFAAMAAGLWVWFTFVRRRWRGAACAAGPHEAGGE